MLKHLFQRKQSIDIDFFKRESYSQEGEDMILARVFENKSIGFYVDIGALHPQRFSNTYYFYLRGWRGINIDATPGSMKLFDKIRSRDINVEAGVADSFEVLPYYCFNEPALNTFDDKLAQQYEANGYKIASVNKINVMPLYEILDRYLPANQSIDFLNIDAEGFDFDILRSNDWNRFCPEIVLVEEFNLPLATLVSSDISNFMRNQGYIPFARTFNTTFYKKTKIQST